MKQKARAHTTTSIRVPSELLTAFKDRLGGRSMNQGIIEIMTAYADSGSAVICSVEPHRTATSEAELADMLANSVADYLRHDAAWAKKIVQTAQLRWPGGILESRMAHYGSEKQYLAKNFSEWLTRRIKHVLNAEDVYLLIDAGSTNLWFCRFLWGHLSKLSEVKSGHKVTLVTNNVPVGEAFAEQSQLNRFKEGTNIQCELLGGLLDSEYAAVVGKTTQDDLEVRTGTKKPPGRYIALAAGNFLRLSQSRKSAYPIPMVRGTGQQEIKKRYMENSHEVYVVAPLGKIFRRSTKDLNEMYNAFHDENVEDQRGPYQEVAVDSARGQFVKLVTTSRNYPKHSILYSHWIAVKSLLGAETSQPKDNDTGADVRELHHFCYPFDAHVENKSFEEQVKIEFPHKWMRDEGFMEDFYGVKR